MKPNHQRFGYSKKEWEAFKSESREIMIECARARQLITYGEIAARMTTISVEPHEMVLWEIIGDVARDEEAAGRFLLSAVVIHKHGDQEPGYGFFELAKYFNRNAKDQTICWIEEVKKLFQLWAVKLAGKPDPK